MDEGSGVNQDQKEYPRKRNRWPNSRSSVPHSGTGPAAVDSGHPSSCRCVGY